MTAASVLGIFFVPVLFVVIERLANKKEKEAAEILSPADPIGELR
jgi:hypothetical protein